MAVPSSAALGPEALEEREVLMSIFRPEEFSQRDVDEWVLSFPDLGVDTDLVVRIPPAGTYPALAPPEADIERPIPGLDVRSVVDGLPFTLGETCVYDWACEVRGKLEELLTLLGDDYPAPGRTASDAGAKTGTSAINPFEINDVEDDHAGRSAPRSDRLGEDLANFDLSTVAPPEVVVSRPKIEIHHGEPFTEKKSTFQAHVADVNSEADVRHVLEVLYQDNRIRRATHNQYAWRIREGGFSGDRDANLSQEGQAWVAGPDGHVPELKDAAAQRLSAAVGGCQICVIDGTAYVVPQIVKYKYANLVRLTPQQAAHPLYTEALQRLKTSRCNSPVSVRVSGFTSSYWKFYGKIYSTFWTQEKTYPVPALQMGSASGSAGERQPLVGAPVRLVTQTSRRVQLATTLGSGVLLTVGDGKRERILKHDAEFLNDITGELCFRDNAGCFGCCGLWTRESLDKILAGEQGLNGAQALNRIAQISANDDTKRVALLLRYFQRVNENAAAPTSRVPFAAFVPFNQAQVRYCGTLPPPDITRFERSTCRVRGWPLSGVVLYGKILAFATVGSAGSQQTQRALLPEQHKDVCLFLVHDREAGADGFFATDEADADGVSLMAGPGASPDLPKTAQLPTPYP
eukprot:g6658.t1